MVRKNYFFCLVINMMILYIYPFTDTKKWQQDILDLKRINYYAK